MGKSELSFFDFITQYPHNFPDRQALAAEFRRLSRRFIGLKDIDSFVELCIAASVLTDPHAVRAITPSLWVEYCLSVDRPFL